MQAFYPQSFPQSYPHYLFEQAAAARVFGNYAHDAHAHLFENKFLHLFKQARYRAPGSSARGPGYLFKQAGSLPNRFNAEFDLVSGRYIIDAKSIMGIFSLDISRPIDLNIHNAEQDQLDEIMEALKPYIVS